MAAQYTDPVALAATMHRLHRWLDATELPASAGSRDLSPGAQVIIDVSSRSPAASLNRNALRLCQGARMSKSALDDVRTMYVAAGVPRFFVWLSPAHDVGVVREWLAGYAATRVAWTRYPTLVLGEINTDARATSLAVRAIGRDEVRAVESSAHHPALMEGFSASLGRDGFHHFAAFDGDDLVATAALAVFEGLGYLTYACTAESHRQRGAQTALIAARIARARELGCHTVVSQTLTMLEHSHANLLRAGFREVYEREVYECVLHPV